MDTERVQEMPRIQEERGRTRTLSQRCAPHTPPRKPTSTVQLTVPEPDRAMSSSSSVKTELSHTADSHEEEVFDDAVSTPRSVREKRARRAEEQRQLEEERARRVEEQRQLEQERARRMEEQRQIEEERARRVEEQRKLEEERARRAKEQRQLDEERARRVEEQRNMEEERARRMEEQRKMEEERARRMEEQRQLEEERERRWAEHRHHEMIVYCRKRQSMRIEAERELLERHLRLENEDARRKAARKAQLLAAEMAREQRELELLYEREMQRVKKEREQQQANEAQASRDEQERQAREAQLLQEEARARERQLREEALRREQEERQLREERDMRAKREHTLMEEQLRRQNQEAARRAEEAARLERQAREEASRRAREEEEALRASMRNKSFDEILQARVTAYEARLGMGPKRSPIEERALKRAKREADDEDRSARMHARRNEELLHDDASSVAETERSAVSRASDASQLTAVMSKLHIVSRQQPPAVKGILSRNGATPSAKPALRFTETRAPSSELRGLPHPDLVWLTSLIQHRLPQPLEQAPAPQPRQTLGTWIRHSMASVATFETAEPSSGFAAHGTARLEQPRASASCLALFEHAPIVHRLLASLDLRDVRVLYDVSKSMRYMISRPDVHERLLCRFLGPAGYVPWPDFDDPVPLTLHDCEAFHMYMYTELELPVASHAYLTDMHHLDRRIPRLARSTARAYSRVLARIRMQPQGVPDVPESWTILGPDGAPHEVGMSSPFVPGYVSTFRAWVPCTDDEADEVWGSEIQRLERELFIAGIWRYLQRGDVVVNATNAHRFVFHGDAFAPLDTRYDAAGHLPPFINALLFPTTYYDWILPQTYTPTMYLDVLPWRNDIVKSLHLTRDNVEVMSPQGPMYRVAKWLYRASLTIDVPPESIAASGFIESAHDAHASWNGRIVIETEGTTEHVCELLRRLVSPADAPDLLSVMLESIVQGTNHALDVPALPKAATRPTYPWRFDRRRSQPGCHWITPAA